MTSMTTLCKTLSAEAAARRRVAALAPRACRHATSGC
jgi:hypothetical protein